MKKVTLLFCLLICSIGMYSQDILEEVDEFNPVNNRQIGINSTALISQLINFSSNFSFFNNDYIFTYKKQKHDKNFRFGFGGNFFYDNEDSNKRTNINANIRIGRERFTIISKRWRVFYGGDFKTGFEYTQASFLNEPISVLSLGGGPICGLQFNINSRLSISTEASYDFLFFRNSDEREKSWGIASEFSLPDFFYLNFDF